MTRTYSLIPGISIEALSPWKEGWIRLPGGHLSSESLTHGAQLCTQEHHLRSEKRPTPFVQKSPPMVLCSMRTTRSWSGSIPLSTLRPLPNIWLVSCLLGMGVPYTEVSAQGTDSVATVKYSYANGRMSSEGQLLNGKPHGYWKNYYESGILRSEGARSYDRLTGPWKFYTPEGRLQSVIHYSEGRKHGLKGTYHENGRLRLLEHFASDLKDSIETTYDINGKMIRRTPFEGSKEQGTGFDHAPDDGRIVGMSLYQNGYRKYTEGFNRKDRQGNRQGMWKEIDDSARIVLETPYRNNLRHGYQKRYDRSGSVTETRKFIDDIEIPEPQELAKLDIKRQYHPNAQLKQIGSYKRGRPEGVHRFYTMDGKLESSKVYVDGAVIGDGIVDEAGLRQGEWKHYFPGGQVQSTGRYVNGQREGKWIFYYIWLCDSIIGIV